MCMLGSSLPPEIECHELLDGQEWRLPPRVDSEPRQLAGKLLLMVGLFDTLVVSGIVLGVLRPNTARVPLTIALGAIIVSGVGIVVMGLWNLRSRATLTLGREEIRASTRLGPIGWSRRVRTQDVRRLIIERDIVKHVNVPGSREGTPEIVTLRIETTDGRRPALAAGYHRRLIEPLADLLARRLGVEVEDREPPG